MKNFLYKYREIELREEDSQYYVYKVSEFGSFKLGIVLKDEDDVLIFGALEGVGLSIHALKEITLFMELLDKHKRELK